MILTPANAPALIGKGIEYEIRFTNHKRANLTALGHVIGFRPGPDGFNELRMISASHWTNDRVPQIRNITVDASWSEVEVNRIF